MNPTTHGAAPGTELQESPEYWIETRQPLVSLVFLAPLLAAYESGVVWLGTDAARPIQNGADWWMRGWLDAVGLGQPLVLPVLLAGGLLGWHLVGRRPWRVSGDTLVGMFAESLLFAFGLVLLGQATDLAFRKLGIVAAISDGGDHWAGRAVSYLGAGIYEEVLFRLCLLPACYGLFRLSRLESKRAAVLAALASSLAFSLAHHIGGKAEPFELFSFTFRAAAGLFFAGLFVLRGFGITVGCHAAYDLLVGILLAPPGGS